MNNLWRGCLFVTVGVIVVRIILEELGAPGWMSNILSVTALHLLVPIYLGWTIAGQKAASPYKTLISNVALYTVFTRLFVFATYSLAYFVGLSALRFSVAGGGGVGADSALQGALVIPGLAFIGVSIIGIIIGSILGSIAVLIRSKTG